MRSSNFVSVTGNMGGPVEMREAKAGVNIARLSVAETVSRPNPQTGVFEQVHTNWIPVTAFGSLAKRAAKSLKKGDRVTVLGTLKTSSFEKDGEARRGFELIAYSIEMAQLLVKADGVDQAAAENFPPFDEFKGDVLSGDPMMLK
jgi:single-strand DNA-binding protein